MYSGPWYIHVPGGGLRRGDVLNLGSAGTSGIPVTRGGVVQPNWGSNFRSTTSTDGSVDYTSTAHTLSERGSGPRILTCSAGQGPIAASWVAQDGPPPPLNPPKRPPRRRRPGVRKPPAR